MGSLIDCLHTKESMWMGYVLQLENGKWYVGVSTQLATRLAQHATGKGAYWTRKHKMVALHRAEIITGNDEAWENFTTLALMSVHGHNNVRGGIWCKTSNIPPPKQLLEFVEATKKCPTPSKSTPQLSDS